jgi:hypothetical protein
MPVNESNTIQYTVTTTRVPDGTTLYWKTTGNTTNSDIVGGNTGSISIVNNQAVFNVTIAADSNTDGTKTLGINLLTGSINGTSVTSTPTPIVVNDTSTTPFTVAYLVVAGGGGVTGNMGGGGAGGVTAGDLIMTDSSYTITVGAGGSNQSTGGNGNGANSSIVPVGGGTSVVAVGGGAGGGTNFAGQPGGSGGGYWNVTGPATTGVPGQGNGGGNFFNGNWGNAGGGGGGASGTGGPAFGGGPAPSTFDFYGGGGGSGYTWPRNSVVYGGGGGGAAIEIQGSGVAIAGSGGSGGGGDGGRYDPPSFVSTPLGYGTDGQQNRGGGAGGKTGSDLTGAKSGGSGIVIITYAGLTAVATGGTITQAGGNTFHTFTSSGTFTLN